MRKPRDPSVACEVTSWLFYSWGVVFDKNGYVAKRRLFLGRNTQERAQRYCDKWLELLGR